MDTHVLGVGSLVAGRYRIVRELGRGAMVVVYVAEHLNTGGLWALKVMVDGSRFSEERARRFRREARASARIVSEHVVKVTDADVAPELGNAPFLVMELLEGEDLERTIEKTGALDPKAAVDILKQMARGLDKAHAAGVIHRDLKPENVFLHRRDDGSTIVKVLDFGISKILQSDRDIMNISLSSTTDVMGTPLYMAPEQAMAKNADVSPATDVWALGLMTVRLLTNEVYWTGQSIPEIFVQIMTPQRDPPSQRWPQLGPEFDSWFAKSTALDPKQRFQSVREQIDALAMVLLGERAAVGPSVTPQGASDAPAAPAVSRAPQLSQSPQLRTQRIPNPFNDDGPSNNAVAGTIEPVGASADDHVQRVALPMSKARPIAIIAAAIAMVGIAIFGFTFLRSPRAEVSQSAGSSASPPPASPSGASLPPAAAPTETAPAPQPVASAAASANEPAPPVQKAAAAPTIAHGNGGNARGAALAPARTTTAVPAAAAPAAPVPAASSAAAPAKPPAHQDLFDTQK